jgi:hypothetical protein
VHLGVTLAVDYVLRKGAIEAAGAEAAQGGGGVSGGDQRQLKRQITAAEVAVA